MENGVEANYEKTTKEQPIDSGLLLVILSNQYHAAKPEKRGKWVVLATPVEPKKPRKPGRKKLN